MIGIVEAMKAIDMDPAMAVASEHNWKLKRMLELTIALQDHLAMVERGERALVDAILSFLQIWADELARLIHAENYDHEQL